jgi:hypothetical protein
MDPRCSKRDNIMLAYMFAVNHQNETASRIDGLASDMERAALRCALASATANSQQLRAQLVEHCFRHGC